MHYACEAGGGFQVPISADRLYHHNRRIAKEKWGFLLNHTILDSLKAFSAGFEFSVAGGDLLLLNDSWYVTHSGLLRVARRNHCQGIRVQPVHEFCDPTVARYSFRATVYTSKNSKGFVGYGDADPSNVSPLVHGAEMRVAETRAVNRALRKAYGIGICSVEELGSSAELRPSSPQSKKLPLQPANGNYGGSKVRDHLCQIIRQHQLDPNLVKFYATDYCGVKTLREAKRQQVEAFVAHLADWAKKDRNALLCQLNSYLSPKDGAA
jgi:hypothetical protein